MSGEKSGYTRWDLNSLLGEIGFQNAENRKIIRTAIKMAARLRVPMTDLPRGRKRKKNVTSAHCQGVLTTERRKLIRKEWQWSSSCWLTFTSIFFIFCWWFQACQKRPQSLHQQVKARLCRRFPALAHGFGRGRQLQPQKWPGNPGWLWPDRQKNLSVGRVGRRFG